MKLSLPPTRRSSARAVTSALVALWIASGCAAPAGPGPAAPEQPAALMYTVESGDSLAAIAARLTGDASRWQAIAAHNGIDDPRRLAVGQRIEIPASLLPASPQVPAADAGTIRAPGALPAPTPQEPLAEPASLPERDEAVVITAVDPNRRFELDPLESPGIGGAPRQVRVIGSYYPVALYTEPRNGAALARRVTPGTLFPLRRQLDGWWQIDTGSGPAYLRGSDGAILTPRD